MNFFVVAWSWPALEKMRVSWYWQVAVAAANGRALGYMQVRLAVVYLPIVSSFEMNEHRAATDASLPLYPGPGQAPRRLLTSQGSGRLSTLLSAILFALTGSAATNAQHPTWVHERLEGSLFFPRRWLQSFQSDVLKLLIWRYCLFPRGIFILEILPPRLSKLWLHSDQTYSRLKLCSAPEKSFHGTLTETCLQQSLTYFSYSPQSSFFIYRFFQESNGHDL